VLPAGAFVLRVVGVADELGVLGEELVERLLALLELGRRGLLLLGDEPDGVGRLLVAQRLVALLQQLGQLLGDALRAVGIRVIERDAERVGAARLEADREPQLVDLEIRIALLGERIERRIARDLLELAAREQQLAVAIADVALDDLLAVGRQQAGLDPLLVEQHRPRLKRLGPGQRERERQRAADHREHRDEPPVAPRLPAEVDQVLQAIARGYR
jgi:hypothetical protein